MYYIERKYDIENLKLAIEYGKNNSNDPSSINGALLCYEDGIPFSYGTNNFPPGVIVTQERLKDRDLKYPRTSHAERSAIYNAARAGKKVEGSILYCPYYACSACSVAIIQSGVKEVVGLFHPNESAGEKRWKETVEVGLEMMKEAGVKCRLIDHFFNLEILRDEQWIKV